MQEHFHAASISGTRGLVEKRNLMKRFFNSVLLHRRVDGAVLDARQQLPDSGRPLAGLFKRQVDVVAARGVDPSAHVPADV